MLFPTLCGKVVGANQPTFRRQPLEIGYWRGPHRLDQSGVSKAPYRRSWLACGCLVQGGGGCWWLAAVYAGHR